jgi:Zn-dependent protease
MENLAGIGHALSVWLLPIVTAITFHEAAHGWMADRLGDDTAKRLGRVTFNPVRHVDPFGTLILPGRLLLASQGQMAFGWAKPVPVAFHRLRGPKRDMIWVALAGPASNFIQAILWALAFVLMRAAGVEETFFLEMARGGVLVNLVMWAFNLFPLPPLDGGRVLAGLLPRGGAQDFLARIEPYGFFIVMGLVIAGIVSTWWLRPLMSFGYQAIGLLISPVTALLR